MGGNSENSYLGLLCPKKSPELGKILKIQLSKSFSKESGIQEDGSAFVIAVESGRSNVYFRIWSASSKALL